MTEDSLVTVKNLVVRYGNDLILDQISFSVRQNEIFIILGGSGCGKTTLLRHIIGLETPLSGQILIAGLDITRSSEKQFHEILKKIGVLFQSSAMIGSMTLAENIALPIAEFTDLPKTAIAGIVRMKLAQVGLEYYKDHLPSEISGGMKKRAGLVRALALNPEILFLDEPTAGLDPVTAAEIDALILDINKNLGTTIIVVTHELASIFAIGQRVIMLDKTTKKIIAHGTPADLKNNSKNPFVRQFFNRQLEPTSNNIEKV